VAGGGESCDNRLTGLGPLAGLVTGLVTGAGTGILLALARAAGWRPGIGCRRPAAAIRGSPGRDYMEHVGRQYYGGRRACYLAHPVAPGSIASYAGRATRVLSDAVACIESSGRRRRDTGPHQHDPTRRRRPSRRTGTSAANSFKARAGLALGADTSSRCHQGAMGSTSGVGADDGRRHSVLIGAPGHHSGQ
jgi:hypothetical protein